MDPKKKLCVVPACQNLRFDLVHKFPMREDRAEIWRKTLKIAKLNALEMADIRKRLFVCSRHFLPSDYKNLESRSLNWNAVPSINLNTFDNPECLDSCTYNVTSDSLAATLCTSSLASSRPETSPVAVTPKKPPNITPSTPPMPALSLSATPSPTAVRRISLSSLPLSPETTVKAAVRAARPSITSQLRRLVKAKKISSGETRTPQRMIMKASEIKLVLKSMKEKKSQTTLRLEAPNLRNPNIPSLSPELHKKKLLKEEEGQVQFVYQMDLEKEVEMSLEVEKSFMSLEVEEQFLTVPGLKTKLDFFWLRDHCRCPKCYNHDTNQRRIGIRDIGLDIRATSSEVKGDQLKVEWSDGHASEYSIENLSQMLLEHRLSSAPTAFTWTKETIQRFSYARVSMNEYLTDDQVSQSVVQSLVDYGVAFVEKVPANATFTEIVIKRLFAIQRTHFGDLWTFSDNNVGFLDTAYTSEPLAAHTDNTYFNDAAGLQILHCVEYEATGGLSLLVDGFKVLENLKAKHPEVYQHLKKYQVPAENKERKAHHTHVTSLILEDPVDGRVQQIRYNIADRAPMNSLSMSEMRQFYSDLQKLAEEVESPANEWWFPLKPGTVMFFNNWRVLHGRSGFSGKRVMCGSYVSRSEFMSLARTMNIVP